MSRKVDKRNLNTKIELANAFKEISKKKEMNKISITDLIKYCNIQYITINQNILEEKLRIAKGGLHILASMLCDDYLIPYMDENEISSIYNNIIK